MKAWFSTNCHTKNTFSKSLNTFWHQSFAYSSVIKPVNSKSLKTFPKRILIRKLGFCIKKYFFPNKIKNLSPFRIDVLIRSHALRTLGASAARNKEIMKPVKTLVLVSNRLNCSKI